MHRRSPSRPAPLPDEVDEARLRILAECDNDPQKVMELYLEYQKQFADRLVNYDKAGRKGRSAA